MVKLILDLDARRDARKLHGADLAALKAAARLADDSGYEISCYWDQSPRRIQTMAADWDIRLRPNYPAVRPEHFDPFANCPQQHANDDAPWHPPAGAPSEADCQDAFSKSFPRRFFSMPIVTPDGRYAVVYEGGWVSPHAGGYLVRLLRCRGGDWRPVATLWGAKG